MNNARRKHDISIFREMTFSRSSQCHYQEYKSFNTRYIVNEITGQPAVAECDKYLEECEEEMAVDFNDWISNDIGWLRPELNSKSKKAIDEKALVQEHIKDKKKGLHGCRNCLL